MIIFKLAAPVEAWLAGQRQQGKNIGFVPTMGALHEGHLSLVRLSKKECDITVTSIFVNPTQFNNVADFSKYPITISNDISMLEAAGCDVLFLPPVSEIYPQGTAHLPHYDLGRLEELLEGHYRPGHFQGVCQVVHRLLQLVLPKYLYMGQKDYQQCMVVQKMIDLTGLEVNMKIIATKRESDGLAMSSRNMRLTADERRQATSIYRQMRMIQENIGHTALPLLLQKAKENLLADGFTKVDYVEIADPVTLEPIQQWQPGSPAVVLVAAFLNEVRLIDNLGIGGLEN